MTGLTADQRRLALMRSTLTGLSIDGVSSGRDTDDGVDGADRAEQVAGQQPGSAESRRAETLSREELLSMENDEASRPEKLRSKFFEHENVENFLDAEKDGAKVVQDVLSPPQHVSAHTLTPMVEITPVPPPSADAGDALTGITVFALLSAEAIRSAARHWRAIERT